MDKRLEQFIKDNFTIISTRLSFATPFIIYEGAGIVEYNEDMEYDSKTLSPKIHCNICDRALVNTGSMIDNIRAHTEACHQNLITWRVEPINFKVGDLVVDGNGEICVVCEIDDFGVWVLYIHSNHVGRVYHNANEIKKITSKDGMDKITEEIMETYQEQDWT